MIRDDKMGVRAIVLSPAVWAGLKALRARTGIVSDHAAIEWLVRAMSEHYARIDRENAKDVREQQTFGPVRPTKPGTKPRR